MAELQRNGKRERDRYANGKIYTLLVTLMSSYTRRTRMHTKAELLTFIEAHAGSEPYIKLSIWGNAALSVTSTRGGGGGTLEVK